MRVIVALESRFVIEPSGAVWSATLSGEFWERYLSVFDDVLVAARLLEVEHAPSGWHRVSRPRVAFHPIPYWVGPAQFIRQWRKVRRSVASLVDPTDAVVLRIGSQVAAMIEPTLRRDGHPYAVEVVGDPHDVFSAGAVRHPLRRFFHWHFVRQMRRQCAHAAVAAYVTESAIQSRYPPGPGAYTTHYSSIDMPADAYRDAPRSRPHPSGRIRLAFVGSVQQMYKAPDVVLAALAKSVEHGLDLELDLVGGGKHLGELKQLAGGLDLGDRVVFHDEVPSGAAIRRILDTADLFVLPSRMEGLPRAMIEAMARGLPCIGSTIGGIPELLPAEDLVPPGDVAALSAKISEVIADPERMQRMAVHNLEKSREYAADLLRVRRDAAYTYLRHATDAHARGATRSGDPATTLGMSSQ